MISATRYKWLVFIISLLLVTNLVLLYLYVNRECPEKKPQEKLQNKQGYHNQTATILEKEVGFTKEQIALYDTLRENHWKSMKPYFEKLRAAKDSFYSLLRTKDLQDTTLENAARRISLCQEAIDLKTFRHFEDVKELCQPEQEQKFEAFIEEVLKRMAFQRRPATNKPNEDSLKKSLEKMDSSRRKDYEKTSN